jgi:hypothetical protein
MSTTGIGSGSNVPGFDVLFPNGEPAATPAAAASSASSSAPSSTSSSSASSSSTSSSSGLNVYQQTLDSLDSWVDSYLFQTLGSAPSTLPEFTAGESVDSFAALATQLGAIDAQQQTGSTLDTTA